MKAIGKTIRISPKKVNLIAGLVRQKPVNEAMTILKFTQKKGAKILNKVIQSAVANAETNFKQSADSLYIKEIIVNRATTMKRSIPISRGRMHPILKRNAHITVTVAVRSEESAPPAGDGKAPSGEAKAEPTAKQNEGEAKAESANKEEANKSTKKS